MNKTDIHPLEIQPEADGKVIVKIATTGGPCGGKTTVLTQAAEILQDMGVALVIVPELATEYMTHGIVCGKTISPNDFQEAILLGTLEREYRYVEIAKRMKCNKIVIVSDRGCMDGMAYTSRKKFTDLALKHGYDLSQISASLYKAVIHLRSLACEFPEMYTCANNEARRETVEEAKVLDAKTESVWLSHPHLRIIGNVGVDKKLISLKEKTNLFVAEIARILGIPQPLEIERKFVLKGIPKLPKKCEQVEIVQYYLKTENGEERLRIRSWNGSSVYYRTQKVDIAPGVRTEKESIITPTEFGELIRLADPLMRPIKKTRYTFVYNNQYFELDVFKDFHEGLRLLEIEITDMNDNVTVPSFVGEYEDVTDDPRYSNAALARAKTAYWL